MPKKETKYVLPELFFLLSKQIWKIKIQYCLSIFGEKNKEKNNESGADLPHMQINK